MKLKQDEQSNEQNTLNIEISLLPLGFQRIHTVPIPGEDKQKKFMTYNAKYKATGPTFGSEKPISKIILECGDLEDEY